jgi:hypothetical protein
VIEANILVLTLGDSHDVFTLAGKGSYDQCALLQVTADAVQIAECIAGYPWQP